MIMVRWSTIAIFVILNFVSCAQIKNTVKQSYAFNTIRIPGTIAVDENGRPFRNEPDTSTTVFVEIKGETPQWNYAWKNDRLFAITATKISELPFEVGRSKSGNELITISINKGNSLWMLSFLPSSDVVPVPEKGSGNVFILSGKLKDQTIIYKIDRSVELMTHEGL